MFKAKRPAKIILKKHNFNNFIKNKNLDSCKFCLRRTRQSYIKRQSCLNTASTVTFITTQDNSICVFLSNMPVLELVIWRTDFSE